ncbi:MAG: hypothetical protein NTY02_19070, partial [Acidobacteria bacterium]|nr:hypothetical protein [Acidobacteriota bacterium]
MGQHPCWIVFYHYVRDGHAGSGPGIRALSLADFRRQLDWLQERTRPISFEEFDRAVHARTGFDTPKSFRKCLTDKIEPRFAAFTASPVPRSSKFVDAPATRAT